MKAIGTKPSVIVLGGAGSAGRVAVEVAASLGAVDQLTVADRDLDRAHAVANEISVTGTSKLRGIAVDVTDAPALRELLADADVVLNTTGPFYKLGLPVLRAAIDSDCHYLDVCDDWEPTIEMLALHDDAAKRGLLAVIGMGASPGTSNLLAAMACDGLHQVEDLYTAWAVDVPVGEAEIEADPLGPTEGPSAAFVHWMKQVSGQIQVVEGGKLALRRPLQPVSLKVPGCGSGTGYTVGHPEPITLHRSFGVTGSSANLMVLRRTTAAFLEGLRRDVDAGRLSLEQAAEAIARPRTMRALPALLRAARMRGPGKLPGFFAMARGRRGSDRVTVAVRAHALPRSVADATGIPLALALQALLEGRIEQTGVHPPEAVFDPAWFFGALAPHCDPPQHGLSEMIGRAESNRR